MQAHTFNYMHEMDTIIIYTHTYMFIFSMYILNIQIYFFFRKSIFLVTKIWNKFDYG